MLPATPNLHRKTNKNNEDVLKQILVSGDQVTTRSLQANKRFKKFFGKKLNGSVLKEAQETTNQKNLYVDPNSNRKFPIQAHSFYPTSKVKPQVTALDESTISQQPVTTVANATQGMNNDLAIYPPSAFLRNRNYVDLAQEPNVLMDPSKHEYFEKMIDLTLKRKKEYSEWALIEYQDPDVKREKIKKMQ